LDARGWLTSTEVDGKTQVALSYNSDATIKSMTYGNGVTVSSTFNDANRLVANSWMTPSGAFANSRDISAGGNISGETLTAPSGSSTFTYTHDTNGRLSATTVSAGLVPVAKTWAWTFDDASNRLTQKATTGGAAGSDYTYAYNKASQLTATTDPAASGGITYDDRGNATQVGPDTFAYDNANNVVSATDGTITVNYERNFAGTVIAKVTAGGSDAGTIRYSSSGILLDEASKPYALRYSLPGGVSVTKALVGDNEGRWQFTSLGGDLFFETDDAGVLQGTAQVFDPYGQVLTVPNAPQAGLPNTTWEAATGNESEALKTAYQLMGARVYIPALGRFAQLDPKVGGSANGYDYVNQDPINFSDPTGNESENWLVNGLTGLAAFAVGALVAPARGALVGVLYGAIAGAAVAGLSHAAERVVTGQTEFSAARLGISILAGALGGVVGRVKWAKAQNQSGGNVNGDPTRSSYAASSGRGSTDTSIDSYAGLISERASVKASSKLDVSSLDLDGMLSSSVRGSQRSLSVKSVVTQTDAASIRLSLGRSELDSLLDYHRGSFVSASSVRQDLASFLDGF
jgi:RHS repeat-associated protein